MNHTILTVDDSACMRQMVAHVLRHAGYNVLEAHDGDAAIAIARSRRLDAVITDQNMHGMDGLSLVQAVRSIDGHAKTPIVLLTTERSDEMKRRGREAGATGWMVKPFDPLALVDLCRRILR